MAKDDNALSMDKKLQRDGNALSDRENALSCGNGEQVF